MSKISSLWYWSWIFLENKRMILYHVNKANWNTAEENFQEKIIRNFLSLYTLTLNFAFRNPQSSCSFISENYRSSCMQVYNYHRLLTWDNKLGLHMDIFKVPSCCSCHVHGYADIFPPHQKDPSLRIKESFPGSDFATSDQKDDFEESPKLNYLNKFPFDSSLGM